MREEDTKVMKYNVTLWFGMKSKKLELPGERMRVRLEKPGASKKDMEAHVMLVVELRDVCVGLCYTSGHKKGVSQSGGKQALRFAGIESRHTLGKVRE